MEVHFGWMVVGGDFLWVNGDGWGWVEVYFGCVGVGGHFLWVGRGGWK